MYKKPSDDFCIMCDIRSTTDLNTTGDQLRQIKSSCQLNSYHIFYDNFGFPQGYIIWANINKESFIQLRNKKLMPKYFYEWSEGKITLLIDCIFPKGMDSNNKKELAKLLKKNKIVCFQKNGAIKLYIKYKKFFTKK